MNKKNDGGPAYPCKAYTGLMQEGMTLRDHFAGLAMQGMLSDLPKTLYGLDWMANTAKSAYELADAMLSARSAV